MSVDARPASAPSAPHEIQPMSQDAEPNAGPDARQMSQLTQSPSGREQRAWISESEWTGYINDVRDVSPRPRTAVSIFRVPEFLKNTKREAYVPQRVSLGPYHHSIAKFSPMDRYKGRALHGMMKKYNEKKGLDSDQYNINMDFPNRAKEEILKLENEIKGGYEEKIDCEGETLARMLCLNGCFLLEVLRSLSGDESLGASLSLSMLGIKENEINVFSSRDIVNDVLMLENQVPFIVLRKLLQLELNSTHDVDAMLLGMVMSCIGRLLKPYYTFHLEIWCREKLAREEVQHLLGFLYEAIVHPSFGLIEDTDRGTVCSICIDCLGPVCSMCIDCLGGCIRQHQDGLNKAPNQFQRIRPAVELRKAGIKFKPCHGGIEEIRFDRKRTTIFLPAICITDITDVLFRNLIAFEVCRPFQITYVSYYVKIMDNLIDSEKDVALLRRMGVLTNWLGGDKEVVDLFNSLSKAVAPVKLSDAFYRLAEIVNAHYEKEIRVQLQLPAELVRDYCYTPWRALASAAAIVLLVLAFVQTIFSVIAVYK